MATVPVRSLDPAGLAAALRELSITMKLDEARRVAELLGRDPTDTELTLFDTMWSEHCSYKSSRSVLKTLPTEAGNVVLGVGEDAGIVRFTSHDGHEYGIAVAHESHNHPSQVMPVEGAATGIGGVVRDVYCMGADVVAVLDPLRFGDPNGPHGERSVEIAREVVEGISMYGNALGVPNLGGDVVFDPCYDDNCLVNVVAIGLVRTDRIIRSRVPEAARHEPYDFILFGKPTDWSGMGGAAFASADLDHAAALENKGSVQVADPFLKRSLVIAIHALLELVEREGVEIGFKDLGAGGIACASSEMADAGGFGIEVDLGLACLADDELPSRVAACSETQERFALAVPERLTPLVLELFNHSYDLPNIYEGAGAAKIGRILVPRAGEAPQYLLRRGDEVLVDAPIATITEGIRYEREARPRERQRATGREGLSLEGRDVAEDLRRLLASEHLCSRRPLFQHYDSEVKANTVIRPGEADAGVIAPLPGNASGIALTVDGNPRTSRNDPYLGGALAVVEACRNLAATGAVPLAVTDCLNYGSPEDPHVFHDFIEGVRGIGDACRGLGRLDEPADALPVISGNVSFYNQSSAGRAVAPSPIVCGVGLVADITRVRSSRLKQPGSLLYRLGAPAPQMGGSLLAHVVDPAWRGEVPAPDYDAIRAELRCVLEALTRGWASAAHDISEGGLLACVAEMALGAEGHGPCGVALRLGDQLDEAAGLDAHALCFGEAGGTVLELHHAAAGEFEEAAARHGVPCALVGEVLDNPRLLIEGLPGGTRTLELAELATLRERTMARLLDRGHA